ncbi:MAG: NAD-dependent deacylase [Terrimicrobiaceae bacterium]|nr:NAD-dependent deacylase [Terrimicrobiaceae bacterium]
MRAFPRSRGFGRSGGPDGLWEGHRVEDVATPEGFEADPDLVHRFYNERRAALAKAEPNAAHRALARLEAELGGRVTIVTQNVDDLHERAGSRNVIHMHGELLKARCGRCESVVGWPGDLGRESVCPSCGVAGAMRPHIVWFGEIPLQMDEIEERLTASALFVSIGTSGRVYPAAGFGLQAAARGIPTIEINPESTDISPWFDQHLRGPATREVPAFVEKLLGA